MTNLSENNIPFSPFKGPKRLQTMKKLKNKQKNKGFYKKFYFSVYQPQRKQFFLGIT